MYDDENWETIADEEIAELIERINPIDGLYPASIKTTSVHKHSLPFYDEVLLVRLTDPGWEQRDLAIYYLFENGTLNRLNGTAHPIHQVNNVAPIKLTESNVLDYLRFYTFFVKGDEGPFVIVENVESPALPPNMDQNSRKIFEKHLRPAEIEGENENGSFLCNAPVLYANSLSIARFEVKLTGEIDLPKYEMVAADLPLSTNAPIP